MVVVPPKTPHANSTGIEAGVKPTVGTGVTSTGGERAAIPMLRALISGENNANEN